MSTYATNPVSSHAAADGARSFVVPSTWPPCTAVTSTTATKTATRVWMHDGNGVLTTRRLKERSSP